MRQDLSEDEMARLLASCASGMNLTRLEVQMVVRLVGEVQRYRDAEAVRHHLANLEGEY